MERIPLPEPTALDRTLSEAIRTRSSTFSEETGIALTPQDLGSLFGNALRRHPNDHRRYYPSGGALYPIETYLIATKFDGVGPGVFHYHPTEHAIERLWDLPKNFDMKRLASKPDSLRPSALIVFTSVWQRSSAKYGDLTYLHALIEAGHMSQNLLLVATALELEVRPYAGFNDEYVTKLLDLDEAAEQAVHTITLSKLS